MNPIKWSIWIMQKTEFGAIDELLAGVAEGGKKGITGADHWTDALRTVDQFGTSREYKINGVTYAKDSGGNYREYSPITAEGKIAWVTSIAAIGNDPLGSIALQYMSDSPESREFAIRQIMKYIDSPEYAKQKARFQLYRPGNNADVRVHAENVYAATRNLFVNSQDKVNQKLLAKVSIRTPEGGIKINTRDLGIDDFSTSTPTESPACNPSLARIRASVPRDELLILNDAKIGLISWTNLMCDSDGNL